MISFQKSARCVRSFYEADTDVQIMQKLIENINEEVDLLKDNQDCINSNLDKIAEFIQTKFGKQSNDEEGSQRSCSDME